jgi:hypothetical protein
MPFLAMPWMSLPRHEIARDWPYHVTQQIKKYWRELGGKESNLGSYKGVCFAALINERNRKGKPHGSAAFQRLIASVHWKF